MSNFENLTVEFALAAPEAAFEAQNQLSKILDRCEIENAAFHHTKNTIALTFEKASDKEAFYSAFSEQLSEQEVERLFKTGTSYDQEDVEAFFKAGEKAGPAPAPYKN